MSLPRQEIGDTPIDMSSVLKFGKAKYAAINPFDFKVVTTEDEGLFYYRSDGNLFECWPDVEEEKLEDLPDAVLVATAVGLRISKKGKVVFLVDIRAFGKENKRLNLRTDDPLRPTALTIRSYMNIDNIASFGNAEM